MSEIPGFNPEEKTTRRDFLRWARDVVVAAGAATTAGKILSGCAPDRGENKTDIFSSDEQLDQCISSESNSEYLSSLDVPAIRNELLKYTENSPSLRAEYERITNTEAVINYAVQLGASRRNMVDKFSQVLEDENYRKKIDGLITKYCNELKVPYSIAFGVAATESGFESDAENPSGAKGVFQVLTDFSKSPGYDRPGLEPLERNVFWGIKYLRQLYDKYGQWAIAAMAYCTRPHDFEEKIQREVGVRLQPGHDTWRGYFKRYNINAITLYSQEYFGLGGTHPFQYPFYNLALAEVGEGVVRGRITKNNMPDLVNPKVFRDTCQRYPKVKGRIINKIGAARANEIFKRLNVE